LKEIVDIDIRKEAVTDPTVHKRLILFLSTIIFFSVLNTTMFNVSLPDIAQQFHLLPSQVSWVVSGYVIFFSISSVTYGRLADTYSIKNLIIIGLILFNAGSLVGFLSQWYPMLIAARIVQASGAGAIPALGMLIATTYFPPSARGRVLGAFASTVAFGAGIGPILGGFITGTFHWRYLFIISTITLFTISSFRRHLPDHARRGGRFDIPGAVLMVGSIGSFLLFITLTVWWTLPLSMILMLCFLVHINRRETPFLTPSLFRNHFYRNMVIIAFLSMSTVFGVFFMIPLMLRDLNELGAGNIGLVMFPGAMIAAVSGTIGGRFVDRIGSTPVVYTGMTLLMAGFILLSTFAGLQPWVIALNMILCYMGFSLLQPSIAHIVSSTLPTEQLGIGMGMYNLFFFTSGAFSAAFIGKLLDISRDHTPINPLTATILAGPYSNLFLLLAGIVLSAASLFYVTVQGASKQGGFEP
jgi:DHA2 family metal-tetracycline-proton antiporter-like MFS transporter